MPTLSRFAVPLALVCLLATACAAKAPPAAPIPGPLLAARLANPVQVDRDARGMAHVYAYGMGDLLFAQGYETARDRLLHMEYWRRFAYGTRAQLWGAKFAEDDGAKRAVDFRGLATQNLAWLDQNHPRIGHLLRSYAHGVNTALADFKASRNGLKRPADLDRIDKDWWPEPWSPVDSLALGRALVFSQNFGGDMELVVYACKFLMGAEKFHDIFRFQPLYPSHILEDGAPFAQQFFSLASDGAQAQALPFGPTVATPLRTPDNRNYTAEQRQVIATALAQLAQASAQLAGRQRPGEMGGSNAWVVAGSHAAEGPGALSCNDPHMNIELPSRLYPMHLVDLARGGNGVFGHTLPGVPWSVFGHTDQLAWGITNSYVDATDLYLEVPCDGEKGVLLQGTCVPFATRDETILVRPEGGKVADSKPQSKKVRWVPHHGPVLNDLVPPLIAAALSGQGIVLSARWSGFRTDSREAVALDKLLTAADLDQGLAALQNFNGGVMNWTLGDAKGRVAYVAAGGWPQRAQPAKVQPPWDPLPGDGAGEWTGILPFAEVPKLVDPKKGFAVTANHQQGPQANDNDLTNDAVYFAHFQDLGSRGHRITKRLLELTGDGKLTLDQMTALQVDDHAQLADAYLPHLLPLEATICAASAVQCDALGVLKAWNRRQDVDSAGAAVFGAWYNHLVREAIADDIPEPLLPLGRGYLAAIGGRTIAAWLRPGSGATAWWDNAGTPKVETATDILLSSFAHAVDQVAGHYAGDAGKAKQPAAWRWGDLHQVRFKNVLFDDLSLGPLPTGGGHRTVQAADYPVVETDGAPAKLPWLTTEGAVFRLCVQLGNPSRAVQALAGGAAADSAHAHFKSQAADWLATKTVALPWTRAEVDAAAVLRVQLAKGLAAP